jgi:predicted DNA-binding antitoxin AbrB/MazE fold protein
VVNKNMPQIIQAIYEHGVLRPLEPLELAERELVSLAIERSSGDSSKGVDVEDVKESWLDQEALEYSQRIGDTSISLAEARESLSGIQGSLADAVSDQRGDY